MNNLSPNNSPQIPYTEFADRLKIAMNARNYTVADLARRIHASHSTISMYRCGSRMPDIEMLRIIAKELHVSTDYLLGLTDFFY